MWNAWLGLIPHVNVFVSDRTAWSDCSVGQIQDWDTLIGQWGRVFLGENATAVAIMAEEDSLVLILEVHFRGIAETILVPYNNWESLNVDVLRGSICSSVGGLTEGDGRSTWLVFKGRKLAGRELVKDIGIINSFRDNLHGDGNLGIENYSKVFVGVSRPDGASEEKKPTPLLRESSTSAESRKFPTGLTSVMNGISLVVVDDGDLATCQQSRLYARDDAKQSQDATVAGTQSTDPTCIIGSQDNEGAPGDECESTSNARNDEGSRSGALQY